MTDIQAAAESLRKIGGVYNYVADAVIRSACPTCSHEALWHRALVGCILEGCECSA
jgi:hypothetical protein